MAETTATDATTEPSDRVQHPGNVNVRALALFFQNIQQQANGQPPIRRSSAPANNGRVVNNTSSSSSNSSSPINEVNYVDHARTSTCSCSNDQRMAHQLAEERDSSSAYQPPALNAYANSDTINNNRRSRPVPRPRMSILRKKWYNELRFDDDAAAANVDAARRNQYSIADSASPTSDDIYSEIDEGIENIYEVLPCNRVYEHNEKGEYSNTRKECGAAADHNKFRSSLSLLIQKSKFLSHRLHDKQIRRTLSSFAKSCDTLLSDTPTRPARNVPRPPSIEQLINRPSFSALGASSRYRSSPAGLGHNGFHDAIGEGSDIYASIGGSESSDYYQGIDDQSDLSDGEEIYHDAEDVRSSGEQIDETIYETISHHSTLPRAAEPLADTHTSDDHERIYYNDINYRQRLEKKIERQQRIIDKRRASEQQKLKKKFNLNGDEIPINWGIVKADARQTRLDLKVKAAEIVLILRMTNNPPGNVP